MLINFYNNKSQNNVLKKDIELIRGNVNANPYDNITITNPIIVVDYNSDLINCNYLYIPDFKRYYYAIATVSPAQKITYVCKCDVLMSWGDMILNSKGCIMRTASISHGTFIQDDKFPVSNERFIQEILFPNQPFGDAGNFILEVRN